MMEMIHLVGTAAVFFAFTTVRLFVINRQLREDAVLLRAAIRERSRR